MTSQETMYAMFLDVQSGRMTFEQFEGWVCSVCDETWDECCEHYNVNRGDVDEIRAIVENHLNKG